MYHSMKRHIDASFFIYFSYLCSVEINTSMSSKIKQLFLNDTNVLYVIIINTIIIFIQESGISNGLLMYLDLLCSVFFVMEMIVKIKTFGFRKYWSDSWNRLDFILVIASLPSIVTFFMDSSLSNLSILLALRLLRIFRIFRISRLFKYFPNIDQIANGLIRALKQSKAILLGFIIIIIIVSLINCFLFKNIVPEYFGSPFRSIYTIFRVFTIEGWYEIPEAIAVTTSPIWGKITRIYFCLLLCGGGIIGMSFINSVFVDAMVEDNNDDIKKQLDRIERQLEELSQQVTESTSRQDTEKDNNKNIK